MRCSPMLSVLFAIGISACQLTGYSIVGRKPADSSYSATNFKLTVKGDARGTCRATVHTKVFDDRGSLGVCGFILQDGEIACLDDVSRREFIDEVFERAMLLLDREEISKAGFYTQRDIGTTALDAEATCVRTEKAWRESYANARVKFEFDPFNHYEFY
jgi:hypothetical protein